MAASFCDPKLQVSTAELLQSIFCLSLDDATAALVPSGCPELHLPCVSDKESLLELSFWGDVDGDFSVSGKVVVASLWVSE